MNLASALLLGLIAGQSPAEPQPQRPHERPRPKLVDSAFLGVEAGSTTSALTDQLSLPAHTGLTIERLVPDSPAAGVLHEHDILTKLDDQILIAPYQFAVLVRGHHPGDEITLTYVRAGKSATATVKLGTKALPPLMDEGMPPPPHVRVFRFAAPGGPDHPFPHLGPDGEPQAFRADRAPAPQERS